MKQLRLLVFIGRQREQRMEDVAELVAKGVWVCKVRWREGERFDRGVDWEGILKRGAFICGIGPKGDWAKGRVKWVCKVGLG